MEDNADDVLTEDNDEGAWKVWDKEQDYAFLMESSSIQYIEQRACNLTQIGGLLDAKGYGIAMRKSVCRSESFFSFANHRTTLHFFFSAAKYRDKFNAALLQLQETGVLARLHTKWWQEKRGGGSCKVRKFINYDKKINTFMSLTIKRKSFIRL